MGRASVWGRLLWKEGRQGALRAAILLAAPAVLLSVAARYPDEVMAPGYGLREVNPLRTVFMLLAAFGVHLVVVFWAAGKADCKHHGNEFAHTHLPVSPVSSWMTGFALPLVLTGLLGAWFGFWTTRVTLANPLRASAAGALDLGTTFALSYFIAAVVSYWAAVFIGFTRTIAGTAISVWDLQPFYDPVTTALIARVAIGAVAGSLVFAAISRRRSQAFRQASSLFVLVAIVLVPAVGQIDLSWLQNPLPDRQVAVLDNITKDPIQVQARIHPGLRAVYVDYSDERGPISRRRRFGQALQIVDLHRDGRVYLAQQKPGEACVRILEWDAPANRVREIGSFSPGKRLLNDVDRQLGSVSPDHRYAMVPVRSAFRDAAELGLYDIWEVDLARGTSAVVVPCSSSYDYDVSWGGDRAVINMRSMADNPLEGSGEDRLLRVDLRAMTARELRIPWGDRS